MTPEDQHAAALQRQIVQQQLAQQGSPLVSQAPAPASALIAPGAYQAPYDESMNRNPKRAFWGGLLMDLAGTFGENRRPMQGLALQNQQAAMDYNTRLQAANQAAQRQHRMDQNAYATAMYGRERHGILDQRADDQFAEQQRQFDTGQEFQQEQFEYQKQQDAIANSIALKKFGVANQANTIAINNALKSQREEFAKTVEPHIATMDAVRRVEIALNEGTGAGDVAGIIDFFKSLDPSSIVSQGEGQMLSEAGGLISKLQGYKAKLSGEGILSPAARQDIARTVGRLGELAHQGYVSQRNETGGRVAREFGIEALPSVIGSTERGFEMPKVGQTEQEAAAAKEQRNNAYGLTPKQGGGLKGKLNEFNDWIEGYGGGSTTGSGMRY